MALLLLGQTAVSSLDTGTSRRKRENSTGPDQTTSEDGLPPEDLESGPSLGEILGLVALVITILYIIGISWKVVKIFKGEYVPTEPVYLKYK